MTPNYRIGLGFYAGQAAEGRPDLAATNAARMGRISLAVYYGKQAGMSAREAYRAAVREWRISEGEENE